MVDRRVLYEGVLALTSVTLAILYATVGRAMVRRRGPIAQRRWRYRTLTYALLAGWLLLSTVAQLHLPFWLGVVAIVLGFACVLGSLLLLGRA